ncbi:MAG: GTP-binding protein [Planctomycetes bacterium]|nr:GTP-binding protein [Planctomycetota bacterium]
MFDLNDTIAAFSSASVGDGQLGRSVLRVCGDGTGEVLRCLFGDLRLMDRRGVSHACIEVEEGIEVDAAVYSFPGPASYTGEDVAEVHFYASGVVCEIILAKVLKRCRIAGGGEFTLRAYLNGKIDLSQAEAVGEIISASNKFQLKAAERLLAGRLCETVNAIREEILEVLSLIEAGMDFSEEDIEFISSADAADRIGGVQNKLNTLIDQTIHYEEMIDLPSVALAGKSNAGKSSLLNVLLGSERSIVSGEAGTTRDVLEGVLELDGSRAIVFDCAGIGHALAEASLLDELGRAAAIEAINRAGLVLFCVDVTADDFAGDAEILNAIDSETVLPVATKCDLLEADKLREKQIALADLFSMEPIMTSSKDGNGIDELLRAVDGVLCCQTAGSAEAAERVAVNERHRNVVKKALKEVGMAIHEALAGNGEIAAMLLRSGYESLGLMEREDVNEGILDRIFSSFCIGK